MKKIKTLYLFIILMLTGNFPSLTHSMEWEVIGEMPFPVYDGAGILIDSNIYILGGYSHTPSVLTDTIQVYDPETQSWNIAGRLQHPRASFVADKLNENIVLIGGVSGDSLGSQNVEKWGVGGLPQTIDINDSINRINATGAIYEQFFYIFGGYAEIITENSVIPFIIEYNLLDKKVTYTDLTFDAQLPYQQTSILHDEDFYLFGGVFFTPSKKIHKYNINNKNYERIYPDLLEPRAGGQSVMDFNNNIYIIGGFNEIEGAMSSIEIFKINPSGYQIEFGPPLNYARKDFMAVYYQDCIYVFGGTDAENHLVPFIESLNLTRDYTLTDKEFINLRQFNLYDNYPNPFNAGTTIQFDLNKSSIVTLEIFSLQGRLIKTLVNTELSEGPYRFGWDGTDGLNNPVASNIYIYRLTTDKESVSKKMILVK